VCLRTRLDAVLNTKHPILTRLVRPKGTDFVYSQDRIAKKKAPSTMSATCVNAKSLSLFRVGDRKVKNFRRNFGVIAF
jgi:copper homeostasis protein CutC